HRLYSALNLTVGQLGKYADNRLQLVVAVAGLDDGLGRIEIGPEFVRPVGCQFCLDVKLKTALLTGWDVQWKLNTIHNDRIVLTKQETDLRQTPYREGSPCQQCVGAVTVIENIIY